MTLEILVNSAIRMLLVGAVAWLALRAVRVRNAHVEALVWRMLLFAGLSLPVLLYWRLAPGFTTSLQLPVLTLGGTDPAATSAHGAVLLVPLLRLLTALYLAGALLLVGRLAFGLVALWRISLAAEPQPLPGDVRISAHIRSPATFGTIVLLPSDARSWPSGRLDAVLAHERAHVRARDGYWSWLSRLHTAIYWFSPLAWWMQRRLESLAEATSDDAVVVAQHDPVAYAALLLEFAQKPNTRSVAMSVAESHVPERIERLLAGTPPSRALPRAARWSAIALLIPVTLLAASTTRGAPIVNAGPSQIAGVGPGIAQAANADEYYPAVAVAEQVTGFAVVEVDLDTLGQLVDARVVKVEPADARFGFADAALQVARNTTYKNPQQQPSSFQFMVKFTLDDK
jgi:TonB family protein